MCIRDRPKKEPLEAVAYPVSQIVPLDELFMQKLVAAKQWSFELFYWDLTVGLFLTALLGAVTLESMGSCLLYTS